MTRKGDSRAQQLRDRYYCQFMGQQARKSKTKLDVKAIAEEIGRCENFVRDWAKSTGVVEDKPRNRTKFACLSHAMKSLIIKRSTNRRTVGKRNSSARSIADSVFNKFGVVISHDTINEFRKSEGFKCYKIRDTPRLSDKNIRDRKRFVREHKHCDLNYFRQIIFTDEKLWGLHKQINHGIEYFWTKDKRKVPKNPRPRQEQRYMLHLGITYRGVLAPKWVPQGATMNGSRYRTILKACVKEIDDRANNQSTDVTKTHLFDDHQDWIWWQDGASSHTAKLTQKYLDSNVPVYYAKGELPGNSPDLNPIENFWAILSNMVYANGGFKTLRALKARIKKCCQEFPQQTLQKLIDSMPKRVKTLAKDPESPCV